MRKITIFLAANQYIAILPVENLWKTHKFLWISRQYLGITLGKMWKTFNRYLYPVEN